MDANRKIKCVILHCNGNARLVEGDHGQISWMIYRTGVARICTTDVYKHKTRPHGEA